MPEFAAQRKVDVRHAPQGGSPSHAALLGSAVRDPQWSRRARCAPLQARAYRVGSVDAVEEREADAVAAEVRALGERPRLRASAASGKPLDPALRSYFEPKLGARLADVRIHHDAQAAELAQGLNARAFTLGRDIYFNAGQYDPSSREGAGLMAHELTHVLQQGAGPAGPGLIRRAPGPGQWLRRRRGSLDRQLDRAREGAGRVREKAKSKAKDILERIDDTPTEGKGAISRIDFDGSTVRLSGRVSYSAHAVSGLMKNAKGTGGVDYTQPRYQWVPNKGPIPAGTYSLRPSEVQDAKTFGFNTRAWGKYRTRLHEGLLTDVRRRLKSERTGGFYLHQDANHNGTAGCIGVWTAKDNKKIHQLIADNSGTIPVHVSYSSAPLRERAETEEIRRFPLDRPLPAARSVSRHRPRYAARQASSQAAPAHYLVTAGIRRLRADASRFGADFPADYYEILSRHLFEVALDHNGRDYDDAFRLLDDLADGDLGFGLQREYVAVVGTDSSNGWDKVRHFTFTAYLQNKSAGFLAPEAFTYGKEIYDELESVVGKDPEGYSIPDIRADNRGEAFAEEMAVRRAAEQRARLAGDMANARRATTGDPPALRWLLHRLQ